MEKKIQQERIEGTEKDNSVSSVSSGSIPAPLTPEQLAERKTRAVQQEIATGLECVLFTPAERDHLCAAAERGMQVDELWVKALKLSGDTLTYVQSNLELRAENERLRDALQAVTTHFADVMAGPIMHAGITFQNGVENIPTIKAARDLLAGKTTGNLGDENERLRITLKRIANSALAERSKLLAAGVSPATHESVSLALWHIGQLARAPLPDRPDAQTPTHPPTDSPTYDPTNQRLRLRKRLRL